MRILFFGGMILVGLGLLAAAVETGAHGRAGPDQGMLMSAYELWSALRPKSLVIFEIRVERTAPWLWDPVMRSILSIPAWALFGVPGGLIAWFSHPGRHGDGDVDEIIESFTLFDDLTREARMTNPKGEEHGPQVILPEDLIDEDAVDDDRGAGGPEKEN